MNKFNINPGFEFVAPRMPDMEFKLKIRCIGKPRPRFAKGRMIYSDKKYTSFKKKLEYLLLSKNIRTPLDGQWIFFADCYYHNAVMPDQDNIAKALMDVIWEQDKQVSGWVERHVRRGQPDGLHLMLWRIG